MILQLSKELLLPWGAVIKFRTWVDRSNAKEYMNAANSHNGIRVVYWELSPLEA